MADVCVGCYVEGVERDGFLTGEAFGSQVAAVCPDHWFSVTGLLRVQEAARAYIWSDDPQGAWDDLVMVVRAYDELEAEVTS